METIGSSEWLIYMHRGEVKVKEGKRDGIVFRPKGSRTWMTTCPPKPNILYKGAMRVKKEEDIQRAKTLVWENYVFNHFDPRKINNKCKECKYLKVTWHNEDYTRGSGECMEIHRRNWENIRGRVFSNQACRYFEKKEEDNMLNDESLKDFQAVLDSTNKTLDAMECMLDRELETRGEETKVDPRAPKNKYGIGETLYLPVKITGVEELVSVNGSTVVYDVRTVEGRYMTTVPESILVDALRIFFGFN